MGYYSFYKIIKDIIKTLFGSKFFKYTLIILIAFTLFFLLSEKGVFAYNVSDYNIVNVTSPSSFNKPFYDFSIPIDNTYENFIVRYYGNEFQIYNITDINSVIIKANGFFYTSKKCNGYKISSNTYNFSFDDINKIASILSTASFTSATLPAYGEFDGNYILYNSFDLKDGSGNIIYPSSTPQIKLPEIVTSIEDLETLNFEVLSINGWDYSTQDLYLLCYDRNSTETESLNNLYPVNEILLNQQSNYFMREISADPTKNAIYWIPKNQIGFDWQIDGSYAFRFAIREPIESEFSDWGYSYLTDFIEFTVSDDVSQSVIDDINSQTKDYEEEKRHQETINAINNQTEENEDFHNTILSNEYNENQIDDTLTGVTSSADSIDDSQYTGLFSAIFSKFSNIINGNYNNVEQIRYPVPNTNEEIVISSDILSSNIQDTFIYIFLQIFWYFLFGMYIFKFSNNLIRKIKDGSILNGYQNNDEVITSTML